MTAIRFEEASSATGTHETVPPPSNEVVSGVVDVAYPLTGMQQGMLFETLDEPGGGVHVMQLVVSLPEAVDAWALEEAWQGVVERHPVLRSAFSWREGEEAAQVVHRQVDIPLREIDLGSFDETRQREAVARFLEQDRAAGFDLGRPPLMRLCLIRCCAERHELVWTFHHIVLDGRSYPLLLEEVFAAYEALRSGREPAPRRPYEDFAAWRARQSPSDSEPFWREALRGFQAPTALPWGGFPESDRGARRGHIELRLTEAETRALSEATARQGISTAALVQGAWALLLARHGREEEVVFGATRAGRPRELDGSRTMVGLFINTLPVRVRVPDDEAVGTWLGRLQEQQKGLRHHEQTPLWRVKQWSEVPAPGPLFESVVMYEKYELEETLRALGGAWEKRSVRLLERPGGALLLGAYSGATRLRLQLWWDRKRLSQDAAEGLLGQLRTVMLGMAGDLGQPLWRVPMLTEAERHRIVVEWNRTTAEYPETTLHELFEAQVARTPDAVAVVFESQELTYLQLDQRANQLAHHLRALGVGAEVLVGLCVERSVEMVIGVLGILKAGGTYVPLDPAYPRERLTFMLEDTCAPVLVTQERVLAELPPAQRRAVCLDRDSAALAAQSRDNLTVSAGANDLAYLIYTSGSTGRPKAVALAHRGAVNLVTWAHRVFTPAQCAGVLAATSICFDLSIFELFVPLSRGGTVFVARDALGLLELPSRERVTLVNTVPSAMTALLAAGGLPASVGTVNLAGEPLKQELVEALYRTGTVTQVCDLYGPSETTTYSTFTERGPGGKATIGRPISNTEVYVLDGRGQPVPVGVPGELYIGGDGLARGYLSRPELTHEKFVPDPFSETPGARLYRTGDLCRYLPDGDLEYLGRLDHQVKLRGYRIELGEIEASLGQHAGVKQCVVLAREDRPGDKALVAYVVADPVPGVSELRAHLGQKLPDYMVPSAFVFLPALPLTPNGKVDRKTLPAPAAGSTPAHRGAAPRSPLEELVAEAFTQVLGLASVGIHEDFFHLGGHSLKATQLVSRLRTLAGAEVPVRAVFDSPTVAGLARHVEAARAEGTGRLLPALRAQARTGGSPLSYAQQRLWFLDQWDPSGATYNLPAALRLRGELDRAALERALETLVARHDVLRTAYRSLDGEPAQHVLPPEPWPLPVVDLRDRPESERQAAMQALVEADARRPFDLASGHVLRARLVVLNEEDHVLSLCVHHIAFDGWSYGVFLRELSALYRFFCEAREADLPALSVQYADYATWQRGWLEGEVLEEQLRAWKKELEGYPHVLELFPDRPRPARQSHRGAATTIVLPPEIQAAVSAFSRREGVTSFMVLLGAFQTLLHRYTGQERLLVGTPVAGRQHEDLEGLIGFFVNTLVVKADFTDTPSFEEHVRQVRKAALAAYVHQDVPFEKLVEGLGVERDPSRSPLFQVMFSMADEGAPPALGALTVERVEAAQHGARVDVSLSIAPSERGLVASLQYNTDLFDPATAERMLGHFGVLLADAVTRPETPVARLALLTQAERQQILVEWNRTEVEFPRNATLPELFEAQAARTPDAPAVVFEGEELSYRELDEQANQLAHYLQSLGVGPEVLVGVCVERSFEMMVGVLGVLKAGGAYAPLDPGYPSERLAFMLEDTGVSLLLSQEKLRAALPETRARVVCLDSDHGEWRGLPASRPSGGATAENLAYVIFTSGSTGTPNGAMNGHRAIVNRLFWMKEKLGFCRSLQKTPFGFDVSIEEIFWPLITGGAVVLARPEGHRDAAYLARVIAEQGVTALQINPSMLEALLQEPLLAECTSLRRVLTGGEAVPASLVARFFERAGWAELHNFYGPTEAAVSVTSWRCERGAAVIPIGRPMANTQIYVLDRQGEPVPVGVTGELYIGGVQVARGYINRPELTEAKFIPDLITRRPGARLYRTGDLCRYLPDGNLEFLGRLDHQVKLRGLRIELGEIEAVAGQHADVKQCVVLAREDRPGDKALVAYVVADPAPAVSELGAYIGQKLPDYMVPASFVFLPALPVTPNGKVDRKALPAPAAETALVHPGAAPRSPLEELVAEAFTQVLGRAAVGIHDDFFRLGGHSLKATQLVSRLRTLAGAELPVRAVFDTPTVAGLARHIEVARLGGTGRLVPPLRALPRTEDSPLSYAQQRLWFLDQWEPPGATYNIPAALRLRGELDRAALERALQTIVARHDVLRTAYRSLDGEPAQHVLPPGPWPLPVVDLRDRPESEREAAMQALVDQEARRPFDLASGRVLRASLVVLNEKDHVLSLCVHHIAFDGWSYGVFLRELSALYGAFCEGREADLPALSVQYADYATWQRGWLEGGVLEEQLRAWKEELAGCPHVLELPADRPRPARQSHPGAVHTAVLPPEVQDAARALARREGVTLFMVLLGAFQALLHRYTGQERLLVGTPVAGRQHEDLEGLIGFFVNTLVMKADFTDAPTFEEHIRRVRKAALAAYVHQDVPFEKLVEGLGVERDPSRSPLFQVMFSMEEEGELLFLGTLPVERVAATRHSAKFDVSLFMAPSERGLVASLEYNTDLFDPATAERMLGHLGVLLTDAVTRPETAVSHLALLTEAERHQILVEWSRTEAALPQDATLPELFEAQAARTPDAAAVVFEGEQLTYREVDERANQLAHLLQSLGVGPDVLVGICMERSLEMIVGLLGILKAGGAYVPFDPTYPVERLARALEDAEVSVLLARRSVVEALPEARARLLCWDSGREAWNDRPVSRPIHESTPASLAYVLFTSGSTGRPKGVAIEHRSIVHYVTGVMTRLDLEPGATYALVSTLAADLGNTVLFPSLCGGGCLHVISEDRAMASSRLAEYFAEHGIDCLKIVPSHLGALLSVPDARLVPRKRLVLGGEASTWSLIDTIQTLRPDCVVLNHYGPTETTVGVLTHRVDPAVRAAPIVPLGRPLPNVQVYLLDGQRNPVPVGVPGEVYIGGPGVARGYLNRPELTEERFVPHPWSEVPGTRLYRTGDLATWLPDGELVFVGRLDHQVKVRGFRVELGEIEAVLGQRQSVKQCVVLAREDRPGDKTLVAYVVADPAPTESELRAHLGQSLPDYMVPSSFVFLPALPLTPNGKVDRRALHAREIEVSGGRRDVVAPRTPLEELLASHLKQILKVQDVGVFDDFFMLGGNSLKAIRLVNLLQKTLGEVVHIVAVFEAPTIDRLSSYLRERHPAAVARIEAPLDGAGAPLPGYPTLPSSAVHASTPGQTGLHEMESYIL